MTLPTGNPPPPMPSAQQPPPAADALQFDRAEFAPGDAPSPGAASASCATCQQPIVGTYYAAGDVVVCPACREQILASMNGGSGLGRLLRATAYGIAGGVVTGLLWFAVGKIFMYIGLIAIVVGFAVGTGVRKGSNDRGGIGYQLLAVFITYSSIVFATYGDQIYEVVTNEAREAPTAVLLVMAVVVAYAAPVLEGFENIIGMLIIGFALWEAWRINKYRPIEFTGPFAIAGGGNAGASPPPPPIPPPPSVSPPPTPPTTPPPPQLGTT